MENPVKLGYLWHICICICIQIHLYRYVIDHDLKDKRVLSFNNTNLILTVNKFLNPQLLEVHGKIDVCFTITGGGDANHFTAHVKKSTTAAAMGNLGCGLNVQIIFTVRRNNPF